MEPWQLTLEQAAARLDSKTPTSFELVRVPLERAAERQAQKAFATLDRDLLLTQAKACSDQRAKGSQLLPLHGLPIALKNNMAAVGMPIRANTPALKDPVGPVVGAGCAAPEHRTETWEPAFGKIRCKNRNLEHQAA